MSENQKYRGVLACVEFRALASPESGADVAVRELLDSVVIRYKRINGFVVRQGM